MNLDEARAIVAAEDMSDIERTLEAISTVLRFHAIADPRLLRVAEHVDAAREMKERRDD